MTIKALMVDVDGVVVRHPQGLRWDRDLKADLGIDPLDLQERFFAPHFEDIVLGRKGLMEVLPAALAAFAPGASAQALVDYWFEKDAHLDHDLLNELAKLRARGLPLHLATVQEHLRADHLWSRLGLKDRFDAIHYAAAYGVRKPQAAFFEAVCERTGHQPQELALIDDSPANVEGARACGWAAVLWDAREPLAAALARAGVVV
ncbi:MAG: HAD family hydrolase [Phenylobacterium sp.]|uniref:HAD family hydrolase n=1 Tax=Phenylobacterium sp. TaxID=1871053 RepID=UPI00391A23CC